MQETIVETIKQYYSLAAIGAALFGLAWTVRLAHEGVRNHLSHLQDSSERMAEGIAKLAEDGAVSKTQHDVQIVLLTAIEINGRK